METVGVVILSCGKMHFWLTAMSREAVKLRQLVTSWWGIGGGVGCIGGFISSPASGVLAQGFAVWWAKDA